MVGTKKEAIPLWTMQAILGLILDERNYPLLIHCNHGRVSFHDAEPSFLFGTAA